MKRSMAALALWALASAVPAAEFFVSPEGDDGNPGTQEQPFATPERARDAIRTAGFAGTTPCTVWLDGGIHRREQPFSLEARDSGTPEHPVIYRGAEVYWVMNLVEDLSERNDIAADNPKIIERLRGVYDQFWADARTYMVNEDAPMEREIVRPYWELCEKHIGPMPELPEKAKKPRKNRKKK